MNSYGIESPEINPHYLTNEPIMKGARYTQNSILHDLCCNKLRESREAEAKTKRREEYPTIGVLPLVPSISVPKGSSQRHFLSPNLDMSGWNSHGSDFPKLGNTVP